MLSDWEGREAMCRMTVSCGSLVPVTECNVFHRVFGLVGSGWVRKPLGKRMCFSFFFSASVVVVVVVVVFKYIYYNNLTAAEHL